MDRIKLSEGIDIAKGNNSKECITWHYWFFNHGFRFQHYVCNGYHGLLILCLNIRDIAIMTVNGVDYCCIIYGKQFIY